jgi:monofunctional glycosyltransferase
MGKVRRRGWLRQIFAFALTLLFGLFVACLVMLAALRWVNPPITMVQIQRRLEAQLDHKAYQKRQVWQPLNRIAPELQHAVVAAEDGRFFQHHGIDWKEVQKVVDKDMEDGRLGRGGSTITQQLVKNLFFTTTRSVLRKPAEAVLAMAAEVLLPKKRILELYLNVVEWGPGVYGAEAAAETWYGVPAARISREQAARLAAILPAPLRRKPVRMNDYSGEIERRMSQTGW